MKILIDLDGIVADLATEWYARWNKVSNREPLRVEDVTRWDVAKCAGSGRIYDILKQPGLFAGLSAFPECQRVIEKLNKDKRFEVFFLTACIAAPGALADKSTWLREHFPFVDPKQFFFGYHKEMVHADIFIDDSPKNLGAFGGNQPNATLVTIDYPYNKDAVVDFRAYDFKDMGQAWRQIEEYLDRIAQ